MNGGDILQLQAAAVLYDHDWRYHTEKRIWLTKVPGLEPQQKTDLFEKGSYTVFDVIQWRRVQLDLTIEYSKLANKPQIPVISPNSSSVTSNTSSQYLIPSSSAINMVSSAANMTNAGTSNVVVGSTDQSSSNSSSTNPGITNASAQNPTSLLPTSAAVFQQQLQQQLSNALNPTQQAALASLSSNTTSASSF